MYNTRHLCSRIEEQFKQKESLYNISKQMNIPLQRVREIACQKKFIAYRLEQFCKANRGKRIAVFDLETSGLPMRMGFDKYYPYNQNEYYDSSRILQLAISDFYLGKSDDIANPIPIQSFFRKPEQFQISEESFLVHHLSNDFLNEKGQTMLDILNTSRLIQIFNECDIILAHNILFDFNILCNEISRLGIEIPKNWQSKLVCSCRLTEFTRLGILYDSIFEKPATKLHDASGDVQVLIDILQHLSFK